MGRDGAVHPVVLYEALVALGLLALMLAITRGVCWATQGRLAGWYLIGLFTARCMLELFKEPQCAFEEGGVHLGQLLSIPMVLLGVYLACLRKTSVQR